MGRNRPSPVVTLLPSDPMRLAGKVGVLTTTLASGGGGDTTDRRRSGQPVGTGGQHRSSRPRDRPRHPGSCTSQAVVRAVAAGGVITFSCGPRPVTIVMRATAKVRNTSARVVLDGGGTVTLSGGGVRRILYMDTCDPAQRWTT